MNSILLFILAAIFVMTAQAAPASIIQARDSMSGAAAAFNSVGLGSCGYSSSDNDMVAALSFSMMDGHHSSELCGKSITVNSASGSVTLKVVDSCSDCSNGDINMTPAAFNQLGHADRGRIPITWSF